MTTKSNPYKILVSQAWKMIGVDGEKPFLKTVQGFVAESKRIAEYTAQLYVENHELRTENEALKKRLLDSK